MNGNDNRPGKEERRLAAVLQLNIANPKQKIAPDDPRMQNWQDEAMQILQREAQRQSGHLATAPRGATLGVFPTARAAADCAFEIQKAIRERNRGVSAEYRFHTRIALHLGDLVEEDGQVSGDAVEVTNWVAALADADGVAMTGVVHTQIKSQIRLKSIRMGTYRFSSNSPRVPVFAVLPTGHSLLLWYLGKRRLRAAILAGALIAGGTTYVAVDQLLRQDLDFDAFSSPALRWNYSGDGAAVEVALADDGPDKVIGITYTGTTYVAGYWGVAASSRQTLGGEWEAFSGVNITVKSAAGHPVKFALYEKGVKAPGKDGEIWETLLHPPTEWREVRILFSQLKKRGTFQPADQDNNNVLNTDRIAALHIDHFGAESDVVYLKNIKLTRNVESNPPGKPLPPSGPDRAFWQAPTSYSASALDPDGDRVKYIFDWGDGDTGETDFHFSGDPVKLAHTWSVTGGCKLRVQAVDIQGLVSEWSDPRQILIALNDTVFEDFADISDVWFWHANGGTILIDSVEGPSGQAARVKYRCPPGSPQDTGVFKMATSINGGDWSDLSGLRFNFKATTRNKFYVVLLEGSKTEPEKTSEQWIFEIAPEKEWTLVEIPFSNMEKIQGAATADNQVNDTMDLDKTHYISFHPSPGTKGTFFISDLVLTAPTPEDHQNQEE